MPNRLTKLRDHLDAYLSSPDPEALPAVQHHLLAALVIDDGMDWELAGQALLPRMHLLPVDAVAELIEAGRADLRRRAGKVEAPPK